MRRILTLTLMTLGLTGGVALADNNRSRDTRRETPTVRDHREVRDVRVDRDRGRDVRVDRDVDRDRDVRVDRDRDRDVRVDRDGDRDRVQTQDRFERPEARGGSEWVAGAWTWDSYSYQWIWSPGHYVRIGRR